MRYGAVTLLRKPAEKGRSVRAPGGRKRDAAAPRPGEEPGVIPALRGNGEVLVTIRVVPRRKPSRSADGYFFFYRAFLRKMKEQR